MKKNKSIDITVVLDRSGSMDLIKKDMDGGFDAFMAEQRKVDGDCRVTLVQFDDKHDTVYTALPVANVPKLDLKPRGGTALLDAIGRAINDTGARLRSMSESQRPHKVLFVIITDGEENSSREFTSHRIAEMTKHQREKYEWEFIYLGANQDAFKVAHALGIFHNAVTYVPSPLGAQAMFTSASVGVTGYRGGEEKTSGCIINQASYDAAFNGTPQVKI